MNEFVNMGKRSIELPAGCKDLIDVLQPAKRHALAKLTISLAEGGLADLAKHLANRLEQGKKTKNLGITWHELNYLHLVNALRASRGLGACPNSLHSRRTYRDPCAIPRRPVTN